MKAIKTLAIVMATMASVQAATVTLSAGFGTSGIIVSTTNAEGVTANTAFTVELGGFSGGIFTLFPATSPVGGINPVAAGGKIAGVFANNNTDSASLSGDAIFVRIITGGFTAILSTPVGELFPDLTAGLASNSVSMGSSANTSIVQTSGTDLESVSFANANTLRFTAVPEPSAALLGALGALGLLRRRRI